MIWGGHGSVMLLVDGGDTGRTWFCDVGGGRRRCGDDRVL